MKINLKKIRTDRNISQEKLAELAGTKQNYISQIENGKKIPSLHMLQKIADALELCIGILLNEQCPCYNCKRKCKEKRCL